MGNLIHRNYCSPYGSFSGTFIHLSWITCAIPWTHHALQSQRSLYSEIASANTLQMGFFETKMSHPHKMHKSSLSLSLSGWSFCFASIFFQAHPLWGKKICIKVSNAHKSTVLLAEDAVTRGHTRIDSAQQSETAVWQTGNGILIYFEREGMWWRHVDRWLLLLTLCSGLPMINVKLISFWVPKHVDPLTLHVSETDGLLCS